jgi:hypothetical protein
MTNIHDIIQNLVKNAESIEDFYEVEVSVLIRKNGGAKSDFFRAQSHWTPGQLDEQEDSSNAQNEFKWM